MVSELQDLSLNLRINIVFLSYGICACMRSLFVEVCVFLSDDHNELVVVFLFLGLLLA